VLEGGVSGKDGVVRLNNRCGHLGSWVDAEFELALLAVVDGQALHEQSSEPRAGPTTEGMEDQETLETGAIICDTADLVKDLINELFTNRVMAAGVVVGGIFLPRDHHFWMEKTAVGAGADFVDHVRLQIAVDGSRNIFAVAYQGLTLGFTLNSGSNRGRRFE
jgi:hypothetical protein